VAGKGFMNVIEMQEDGRTNFFNVIEMQKDERKKFHEFN